jgi:hypothetical protein
LHGKTYDHKLPYDNIVRIFCLQRREDFINIVLSLEPPLRQATTRYKHIVMQLPDVDDEAEVLIQMAAAETSQDKLEFLKGACGVRNWGMRVGAKWQPPLLYV